MPSQMRRTSFNSRPGKRSTRNLSRQVMAKVPALSMAGLPGGGKGRTSGMRPFGKGLSLGRSASNPQAR